MANINRPVLESVSTPGRGRIGARAGQVGAVFPGRAPVVADDFDIRNFGAHALTPPLARTAGLTRSAASAIREMVMQVLSDNATSAFVVHRAAFAGAVTAS